MLSEICSIDLEKEIILMQQELCMKRSLLNACREKLNSEVSDHMQTKSTSVKYLNENSELKVQLDISLAATKKLEEESNKNRELLIKLQIQVASYQHERLQLLERCYAAENENMNLKRKLMELNEELRQHLLFENNYKIRQSQTEALVNETITLQETLNKEQKRLEVICKESLKYTEKLSEECKFQMKFVHEANTGHRKMEKDMIRLMAAFRESKRTNHKESPEKVKPQNYLEEWKRCQEEAKRRHEELEEYHKRLEEELKFVIEQNEILMQRCEKMSVYTFAAVFLVAHLMLPEEMLGVESTSKSRLRGLERRYQLARYPVPDLVYGEKDEILGKRQEQFDDYGHMRFGKRGEESDDYGHMRFGKRD